MCPRASTNQRSDGAPNKIPRVAPEMGGAQPRSSSDQDPKVSSIGQQRQTKYKQGDCEGAKPDTYAIKGPCKYFFHI